jgi:hypothetical protein
VVVLEKLSQVLSELCSTVGVKAFSNTTGGECTALKENRTCFCQQKSSFSANFCVQYTSPKLMQLKTHLNYLQKKKKKPFKFVFIVFMRIDRSLVGTHNWPAILYM